MVRTFSQSRDKLTDPQRWRSRIGDSAHSILKARRAKCFEQLESRRGSNRCRIRRYHSIDGVVRRWKYISVSSINFSVASAVSSSAFGCPQLTAGTDPMQRKARSDFRRAGDAPSGVSAGEDSARHNLNNCQTTQKSQAGGEPPAALQTGKHPVQSNQQTSGVPKKKEADNIQFEKFQNSNSFVIWKMHLAREVCSSSSFPTEAMVWISKID